MSKIFWIAEKSGDYMEISAFNNKRKAEEKALELASHFSLGDNEVPKEEDNYDGDDWLYSGMINAKECFIIGRRDGMPFAAGFNSEDEAEDGFRSDSAGACFPVKLKGGMGEVYLSSEAEASGNELWVFEDGEIYEKKNNKIKKQTTMKHIPTFESFIGSQKVNEGETDPHGNLTGVVVTIKGTKLKYAYFDSDMGYSGTICAEKDIKALESFYLDGAKPSTTDGVKYPTDMWDVYSEYSEEEAAWEEKFAPITKALGCKFKDLVYFELLHNELDYYTEEEYESAQEKDEELEFVSKKFKAKSID